MAATQIAIRGAAVIAVLMHVVWLNGGAAEAVSFILIPFVAAVTIGAAVTSDSLTAARLGPRRSLRTPAVHGPMRLGHHCGICHRAMARTGAIWLCSSCDLQGADSAVS